MVLKVVRLVGLLCLFQAVWSYPYDGQSSIKLYRKVQIIGASNLTPENVYSQQDLLRGMDPILIRELLLKREPIVQRNVDSEGVPVTITYSLTESGDIMKETVAEPTAGSSSGVWDEKFKFPISSFPESTPQTFVPSSSVQPREWTPNSGNGETNIKTTDSEWINRPNFNFEQMPSLDDIPRNRNFNTRTYFPMNTPDNTFRFKIYPEQPIFTTFSGTTNFDSSGTPSEDPEVFTKLRKISKTLTSPGVPRSSDLDPNMLEILQRAGINPDDIQDAKNGTIAATRTLPNGVQVRTTYTVKMSPPTYEEQPVFTPRRVPTNIFLESPPNFSQSRDFVGVPPPNLQVRRIHVSNNQPSFSEQNPFRPSYENPMQVPTVLSTPTPATTSTVQPVHNNCNTDNDQDDFENNINKYLKRVNLTPQDFKDQHGEIIKNIIEGDGRILSVKFTLSNVRGTDDEKPEPLVEKPIR